MLIPTLSETYNKNKQELLESVAKNPELLREVLDQGMIDEMESALTKIAKLLSAGELEKLGTMRFGLQKAHDELSRVLDYGPIKQWASTLLPKGFTALGRLSIFTNGIARLFKQLPKIVGIVKGSMSDARRAMWDENKPLDDMIDDKTKKRLRSIILKAMTPTQSFNFLGSKGLPYINDDEAVSELLSLSFNELSKLAELATTVSDITPKSTAAQSNIAQDIKAIVTKEPQKQPQERTQPAAAGPTPRAPVVPPAASAQKPAEKSKVPMPLRANIAELDIAELIKQTHVEQYGETRPITKPAGQLYDAITMNLIQYLKEKGHAI